MSLVINANKYSPASAMITLEGRINGSELQISIIGQSEGIGERNQARLFTKYVSITKPPVLLLVLVSVFR
jgi:K+-sensing histidine kinase KdpD